MTPEQIDAAKAEFVSDDCNNIQVCDAQFLFRNNQLHKWESDTKDVRRGWGWLPVYDPAIRAALRRACGRAHLAECRRLGVPVWTLDELLAKLGPMPLTTNATKWNAAKEFLDHLTNTDNG